MTEINRPLTDEETQLLVKLATHTLADQADNCSHAEAKAVIARLAAEGKLEIKWDPEQVRLFTNGNLLVDAKREWLAFYANNPDEDPLKDMQWGHGSPPPNPNNN